MDVVDTPPANSHDIDPKQQLSDDVERVRAERDELDRLIAADRERLVSIRTALDKMVDGAWRDVYGQQQRMREIVMRELGDNLRNGVLRASQGDIDAAQAAARVL